MNRQKKDFSVKTAGKCILAGEHAVLEGHSLLAKSIEGFYLQLKYISDNKALNLEVDPNSSLSNENMLQYFYSLLGKALKSVDKDIDELKGTFYINSNIPMCTGMGFSAAICHAVARWVEYEGWLDKKDLFQFSRSLEDLFHGKSSGADVAASMNKDLILFKMDDHIEVIPAHWKPHLYIKTTDSISYTSESVKKVKEFRKKQSKKAENLDLQMHNAVLKILSALNMQHESHLEVLQEGIEDASNCFKEWDLIPPHIAKEMERLKKQGAIAVKPTGAGGGGCILSLWKEPPSGKIKDELIKVF